MIFPEHYGLSENNILIRNHKNPNLIKFMKKWWKIVKKGSKRDQLSYIFPGNIISQIFVLLKENYYYFKIIRKHKYTH